MLMRFVVYGAYTADRLRKPPSSSEEAAHTDVEPLAENTAHPELDIATVPTDIEVEFDEAEDSDPYSPKMSRCQTPGSAFDPIPEEVQVLSASEPEGGLQP